MEDSAAPTKRTNGRSLAALNKSLEHYRNKFACIKPDLISYKRKNENQGKQIEELKVEVEYLNLTLVEKECTIKDSVVESRVLNRAINHK